MEICHASLKRKKNYSLRLVAFPILIFTLLVTFGCVGKQKEQAKALVKEGVQATDSLSKYYDKLAKQRDDHRILTAFKLKRSGVTLDNETISAYKTQGDALAARSKMAQNLGKTYASLGKLIDYDASGEVSKSALDLKSAIEDVIGKKLSIPGASNVDPNGILSVAVQQITEIIQVREFRKNATKAQTILKRIEILFEAEKTIYKQISDDYYQMTLDTAKYLNRQNQLLVTSFVQPYIDMYNLKLPQEFSNDEVKNSAKATLEEELINKNQKLIDASDKDRENVSKSLADLVKTQDDFILKRKPNPEK